MILRAACDLDIDLKQSWFVGDILNDVEAGRKAGCKTVLIDNGNETEWVLNRDRMPHHVAGDLAEAAFIITAVGGIAPRVRSAYLSNRARKRTPPYEYKPPALHRYIR